MWMIRAGRGGENLDDFVQKGVMGFGDPKLGKLSLTTTKKELLKLYAAHYPEDKEGSRLSWSGGERGARPASSCVRLPRW